VDGSRRVTPWGRQWWRTYVWARRATVSRLTCFSSTDAGTFVLRRHSCASVACDCMLARRTLVGYGTRLLRHRSTRASTSQLKSASVRPRIRMRTLLRGLCGRKHDHEERRLKGGQPCECRFPVVHGT
jgi:hypothetical protein